jgi:hypothetical protein
MMPRRRDSYSGPSQRFIRCLLRFARAQNHGVHSHIDQEKKSMTSAILLLGPLTVVIGCLYWVMSLGKQQAALNAELWPRLRK